MNEWISIFRGRRDVYVYFSCRAVSGGAKNQDLPGDRATKVARGACRGYCSYYSNVCLVCAPAGVCTGGVCVWVAGAPGPMPN